MLLRVYGINWRTNVPGTFRVNKLFYKKFGELINLFYLCYIIYNLKLQTMAITSITIGVTRNKGSYQSLKIELTSSVGEGENYADEKANLISELAKLESESGVLFETHNAPDHKSHSNKAQDHKPDYLIKFEKHRDSPFAPKDSSKSTGVALASKIAASASLIEPAKSAKPKANPFATKAIDPDTVEKSPEVDSSKPKANKIANPFAQKPKTDTNVTPGEDLEKPY